MIDGQQRLATLSLIVLAAMDKIKKLAVNNEAAHNNERLKEITGRLIGSKDIVSLTFIYCPPNLETVPKIWQMKLVFKSQDYGI